MPYNGSGSFSVVNTFVPNTTISSSAMNANMADIATNGLSAVLTRDGQSSMTGQLKAANGTVLAPSITFSTDVNTGIYRVGSDNIGLACGGAKIVDVGASGVGITGALNVSGTISQGGNAIIPVGLGPLPWSGLTAPAGWLLCYGQSLLRADYAALWAFAEAEINAGNTLYTNGNGSTTFTIPDMRGRLPAGKDNMGGSAANRLTSTTMTPDGNTLGAVGGSQTHTLIDDELPSITPTLNSLTLSQTTFSGVVTPGTTGAASAADFTAFQASQFASIGAPTLSSATISSFGSDDPHNNVQPTVITNYILKY